MKAVFFSWVLQLYRGRKGIVRDSSPHSDSPEQLTSSVHLCPSSQQCPCATPCSGLLDLCSRNVAVPFCLLSQPFPCANSHSPSLVPTSLLVKMKEEKCILQPFRSNLGIPCYDIYNYSELVLLWKMPQ